MRQIKIIATYIFIATSVLMAQDRAITWETQLRRFNPILCCATELFYDGSGPAYNRYFKKLSDLDTSITKLKKPLRDSIRFSYLGTDENMNDTLLVKSNRDTCGLTYLMKINPHASNVFGIFPKPPKFIRHGKMVWNTSLDTLGFIGEINCTIDKGICVFDPKSIIIKSKSSDSSIAKRQLNADTQRSPSNSNYTNLIKSFEESARKDSINQIELACADRSITKYTGKCPNDIVDTATIKKDPIKNSRDGFIQGYLDGSNIIKPMIYLYPEKVTEGL